MGSSAWETGKVLVEFAGGNSYVFMVCGVGYGTLGIRAGSLVWPRVEQ